MVRLMKEIVVRLPEELVDMIMSLQMTENEESPYYLRSQSQIAKLLIKEELVKAFNQYKLLTVDDN